jgi:hypothetical protein
MERTGEELLVAYYKVLFWNFIGETENLHFQIKKINGV